ncbi:hypothetical protein GPECTOR_21g746 [Gonium pectorale]|uniref:Fungal lipase-type domain-containing protein n=1 Tax=Gonium pectorale TaxID=33097 RepID=A0A150GJ83_GONPE|nr:hypothetical protein GPECTOR_21g746 [Gonium pectorale]|eukprot:KXZ49520.1 hypothetical protein GPECTOR_21g746 [Gonium pectorale]
MQVTLVFSRAGKEGVEVALEEEAHDVVLRIEFAWSAEIKAVSFIVLFTVLAGVAVTTYIKVRARQAGTSWYFRRSDTSPTFGDNFLTGCFCVALVGGLWAIYVVKGLWLRLRRLRWDHRRRRAYLTRLAELTALGVAVAAWTYSGDERRLERDCNSFNYTLLWTYTLRLTMSNVILCLWTMTARGMTVWRGAPLTAMHRARLLGKGLPCCGPPCGACERASSDPGSSNAGARSRNRARSGSQSSGASGKGGAASATEIGAAAVAAVTVVPRPGASASAAAAAAALTALAGDAGEERLYIDAPWWQYALPVLWLWLPFQALVLANVALMRGRLGWDTSQEDCLAWFLQCRATSRSSFVVVNLLLAAEVLYVAIYFYHCLRAFSFVRSRSYVEYRQLNIYLSVETRIRGVALLFILGNDLVQALVVPEVQTTSGYHRCRYSIDIILGNWSAQRFAWTEAELPLQRARRLASAPQRDARRLEKLLREPMFCFETAVKLTYWWGQGEGCWFEDIISNDLCMYMLAEVWALTVAVRTCEASYYYEEENIAMRVPLDKIMALYGLVHIEVLREVESDAKAMIAWNDRMCLICFRGTASLKAACVDLQAMLVPYYNRAAWDLAFGLKQLAAVHSGFQWSWRHAGFNTRVLDWVRRYLEHRPSARLLLTGHSLGGAHAMLCTLDLAHALRGSLLTDQLSCYTFGAPRVGNHAFAAMYNKAVNETWNVVNGNDMVPLTPKFVGWFVYKHPGHKVIVKRRGDIIVRPTFTENAVVRRPGSRSVRHHLLGSYLRSYMAVLRSQTRGKHIEGGVRGLMRLASFNLPEVEAVLDEISQEVQAVAAAAARAASGAEMQRTVAGASAAAAASSARSGSAAGAAAVAAAAASSATRGGSTVYASLARYSSLRLLMAHVPPQSSGHVRAAHRPMLSSPEPSDITHWLNLGMEMFGVDLETGGEEEARQSATPPLLASILARAGGVSALVPAAALAAPVLAPVVIVPSGSGAER